MLRTIIAVVLGLAIGSMVNMGIITIGPNFIAPPEGVDVTDVESLKANAHLFEDKHFLFPWLAHALGTLVGAIVASLAAKANRARAGVAVGAVFSIGGVMMVMQLPSPIWFILADLGLAYIPMGMLGHRLASQIRPS